MNRTLTRTFAMTALAAAALSLSACGGGGASSCKSCSTSPAPTPATPVVPQATTYAAFSGLGVDAQASTSDARLMFTQVANATSLSITISDWTLRAEPADIFYASAQASSGVGAQMMVKTTAVDSAPEVTVARVVQGTLTNSQTGEVKSFGASAGNTDEVVLTVAKGVAPAADRPANETWHCVITTTLPTPPTAGYVPTVATGTATLVLRAGSFDFTPQVHVVKGDIVFDVTEPLLAQAYGSTRQVASTANLKQRAEPGEKVGTNRMLATHVLTYTPDLTKPSKVVSNVSVMTCVPPNVPLPAPVPPVAEPPPVKAPPPITQPPAPAPTPPEPTPAPTPPAPPAPPAPAPPPPAPPIPPAPAPSTPVPAPTPPAPTPVPPAPPPVVASAMWSRIGVGPAQGQVGFVEYSTILDNAGVSPGDAAPDFAGLELAGPGRYDRFTFSANKIELHEIKLMVKTTPVADVSVFSVQGGTDLTTWQYYAGYVSKDSGNSELYYEDTGYLYGYAKTAYKSGLSVSATCGTASVVDIFPKPLRAATSPYRIEGASGTITLQTPAGFDAATWLSGNYTTGGPTVLFNSAFTLKGPGVDQYYAASANWTFFEGDDGEAHTRESTMTGPSGTQNDTVFVPVGDVSARRFYVLQGVRLTPLAPTPDKLVDLNAVSAMVLWTCVNPAVPEAASSQAASKR